MVRMAKPRAKPKLTPEGIERRRLGLLRYYAIHGRNPEWSRHISEAKKGKPSIEKGRPKPSSRYKRSEETKRRMSEGRKSMLSEHPELIENLKIKLSGENGRVVSPKTREKQSLQRQRYFIDHPEAGKQHGQRMKIVWQRPSYIEAVVRARNIKPNKQELQLGKIIEEVCPAQFKYNGDFRLGVVLNRYIPDFVNINGKKQVIEFFGSYWHRQEGRGEQDRIAKYRDLGWDCLVVWDSELANVSILKDKLKAFAGGRMS